MIDEQKSVHRERIWACIAVIAIGALGWALLRPQPEPETPTAEVRAREILHELVRLRWVARRERDLTAPGSIERVRADGRVTVTGRLLNRYAGDPNLRERLDIRIDQSPSAPGP